jgi:serine/threonine protein kinase
MGEVYRARDTRLHRDVAVKVLPQAFQTESARERFQREARAASALNHPNICAVYDVGEAAGHPFLFMELLEGRNAPRADCRQANSLHCVKMPIRTSRFSFKQKRSPKH